MAMGVNLLDVTSVNVITKAADTATCATERLEHVTGFGALRGSGLGGGGGVRRLSFLGFAAAPADLGVASWQCA